MATGTFTDADSFHKTSGMVKILQMADGSRILRLEGFHTTNGSDLFVYLSTSRQTNDFNLGSLKGNMGGQNYDIPSNADLESYRYALIYCRAFSVLLGSVEFF